MPTTERRCVHCKALLFEVRGITIIKATKGFRLEVQALGIVETQCKCGTIDYFLPRPAKHKAAVAAY